MQQDNNITSQIEKKTQTENDDREKHKEVYELFRSQLESVKGMIEDKEIMIILEQPMNEIIVNFPVYLENGSV